MSNSSKPAETILKLRVRGRVQGVGYRRSLEIMARSLDLAGWVRNRADGSVEALVAGDPAAVAELCEWARIGPPLARVDAVDTAVPEGEEAEEWVPHRLRCGVLREMKQPWVANNASSAYGPSIVATQPQRLLLRGEIAKAEQGA